MNLRSRLNRIAAAARSDRPVRVIVSGPPGRASRLSHVAADAEAARLHAEGVRVLHIRIVNSPTSTTP